MTTFRVNCGHYFAKPYESDYNIIRRRMTVNPGIPLSILRDATRNGKHLTGSIAVDPSSFSIRDPELTLQVTRYDIPNEHHRQCHKCARVLYHTSLYALPWLTQCPIHHCRLTERCPACKEHWPEARELARRDCPVCGLLALKQLFAALEPLDCRPIGALYQLIQQGDTAPYLVTKEAPRLLRSADSWMRKISVHSTLYPSLRQRQGYPITCDDFDRLHIHFQPLRQRSTRMSQIAVDEPTRRSDNATIKQCERRFIQDFRVMNRIVEWIARKARHRHLTIANYRQLREYALLKGPMPCPYCLALSVWFFHIAAKYTGSYYDEAYIDDYPIFDEYDEPLFFDACEPAIYINHIGTYSVTRYFGAWFYRRALEIQFLNILDASFWVCRRFQERSDSDKRIPPSPALAKFSPSTSYTLAGYGYSDNSFHLFYEHEHPMEHYRPPAIRAIVAQCRAYQAYNRERLPNKIYPFSVGTPTIDFSWEFFRSLHSQFQNFASCGIETTHKRFPGVLPYHLRT